MIYKVIKTCLDRFLQINYQDVAFTAKQLFISAREHANAPLFVEIIRLLLFQPWRRKITKEKPYYDNWGFTVTNVQLLSRARELNLNKNTVSNNESSSPNCLLFGGTDSRNGRDPRSQGPSPGPGNGRCDGEERHSWPRPQQWQRRPRPSRYVSGGRA